MFSHGIYGYINDFTIRRSRNLTILTEIEGIFKTRF